jgi:hypothetical protein
VLQAKLFRNLVDTTIDCRPIEALLAQGIGEIVPDPQMGIKREGLKDHRHVASLDGGSRDVPIVEPDRSRTGPFDAVDAAKRGRLAAGARPEPYGEFARFNLQVQPIQGMDGAEGLPNTP